MSQETKEKKYEDYQCHRFLQLLLQRSKETKKYEDYQCHKFLRLSLQRSKETKEKKYGDYQYHRLLDYKEVEVIAGLRELTTGQQQDEVQEMEGK